MLSTLTTLAVALLASSTLSPVSAQSVDPSTISPQTKATWCSSQLSSCPLLCSQLPGDSLTTISNTCDDTTLAYSCVCQDGQVPNAANFSQTIPYFLCTQANTQCVNDCSTTDTSCQAACRQSRPCGAQNPTRINTTSSSTQSATGAGGATKTNGGTVFTGLGGAPDSTTSSSKKSAATTAVDIGRSFGVGILVTGLIAGFALLL